ncbi:MAG: hypothetical protein J5798_11780 [Spirochaetaceae bacterium]|nr:hypothetical protein [Spirochaetaceae bacterium]
MKKVVFLLLLINIASLYAGAQEIVDWYHASRKEQRAVDRGNKIIAALETYYNDNGFYPQELDELVPKYLPKIENTGLFNFFMKPVSFIYRPEFSYVQFSQYYNLYFTYYYFLFFNCDFWYSSERKIWSVSD